MAIEDILQVKESVTENPMGDPQTVNQAEFLRFQEQMGLGPGGVIAKLIQMFVEEPSEFTRKFGVEAADSVREFLGNQTQKELENQGRVFAPDSAEIIGQNISSMVPIAEQEKILQDLSLNARFPVTEQEKLAQDLAIGTLQTDQADRFDKTLDFIKERLDTGDAEKPDWITQEDGKKYQKEGETTDLDSLTEWMEEKGLDGLNIDKSHLDRGENTLRVITDEEAEALGFKTGDGRIYQIDEETGDVALKKPGLIEGGILKLMDWFKYGRTDKENR